MFEVFHPVVVFVMGVAYRVASVVPSCLQGYYTTKFVICQYVLRNLSYENRNIFPFCVLIYYEIRATISRRKDGEIVIKFKVKVMLAMRGMTQKELAERTGIRPPTVSAICVGSVKHLPVDALEKICDVLDCQPVDLMEYVREPAEVKA